MKNLHFYIRVNEKNSYHLIGLFHIYVKQNKDIYSVLRGLQKFLIRYVSKNNLNNSKRIFGIDF